MCIRTKLSESKRPIKARERYEQKAFDNLGHETSSARGAAQASLNQGSWLDLEKKTAKWANKHGRVWIITPRLSTVADRSTGLGR